MMCINKPMGMFRNHFSRRLHVAPAITLCAMCTLCAACVELALTPVGDIDTETDNEPSTDSATDFTASEVIRIAIPVTDEGAPDEAIVSTPVADEAMQTLWYPFQDDVATLEMTMPDASTICASGTVGTTGVSWSYAGIGMALCYTDGNDPSPYTLFPLSDCPLISDLESRILGVAFTVEGSFENASLELHLKEQNNDRPTFFPIVATDRRDYLFENAQMQSSAFPLQPGELIAIQLQAQTRTTTAVSFDFCIRNLELLLAAQ